MGFSDIKNYGGLIFEVMFLLVNAVNILIFKSMRGMSADYYMLNCSVYSLGFFLCIVLFTVQKKDITVDTFGEKYLHLAMMSTGFVHWFLATKTYQLISVADASAILKSSPVFVTVFAYLFLKERFGLPRLAVLALTICGVVLICRPTFLFSSADDSNDRTLGTICGVSSCILSSSLYVIRRKIIKTPLVLIPLMNIIPCVLFLSLMVYYRASYEKVDCSYAISLFMCGLCFIIAAVLRQKASRMEDASRLALVGVVDLPFILLAEYFIFGTQPPWTSYTGAAVITVSSILVVILKKKETALQLKKNNRMQNSGNPVENINLSSIGAERGVEDGAVAPTEFLLSPTRRNQDPSSKKYHRKKATNLPA